SCYVVSFSVCFLSTVLLGSPLLLKSSGQQVAIVIFKSKFTIERLPRDICPFNLQVQSMNTKLTASLQRKLYNFCAYSLMPIASFDKQLVNECIASMILQTIAKRDNDIANRLIFIINQL